MKFIGTRLVAIGKIRADESIPKRQKKAGVVQLARSIAKIGLLHDLTIDTHYKLIAGHDRFAALLLAQATEASCKMYEAGPEETEMIANMENARRRHDPVERDAIEVLLAKAEAKLIEGNPLDPPTRRAVREEVAKQLDITAHGVEIAEKREKRAKENRNQDMPIDPTQSRKELPEGPPPIELETWGFEMDEEWLSKLTALSLQMTELLRPIQQAISNADKLASDPLLRQDIILDVVTDLRTAAARLKQHMPHALCPWCKGQAGVQEQCAACVSTGWIGKGQALQAPKELRDSGNVSVNGKLVSIESLDWNL